ncbi:hypothetical protein FGRMN_6576 [Fusarium graminum]|nr:hypothetical protein FGRMN_6576 [Fusarium graminum]
MSLFTRTVHSLSPHTRSSLPVTKAARRANSISYRAVSSPTTPLTWTGRRNFSVASSLGETVTMTADSLSWVHGAGMPWYVAIPLLAVGINATIRFPLQLYSARMREAQKPLTPLIMAWSRRHAGDRIINDLTLPERIRNLRLAGAVEKSRRRIFKAWGVQRWKSLAPLLGMVPFVTISEALRRKCGAPLGWISHQIGLGNADSTTAGIGVASSMFDESLVNGGLLWFTDLASADPYYGLPIICSGILIWSTWGRMPKQQLRALLKIQPDGNAQIVMTRVQQLFGRAMLMMPILPLLFADLPSAIFLYWGTSFALTRVNELLIGRIAQPKVETLIVPKSRKELPFLTGNQSRN